MTVSRSRGDRSFDTPFSSCCGWVAGMEFLRTDGDGEGGDGLGGVGGVWMRRWYEISMGDRDKVYGVIWKGYGVRRWGERVDGAKGR